MLVVAAAAQPVLTTMGRRRLDETTTETQILTATAEEFGNAVATQKLTAGDAAAGDEFGHAVSISGSLIVVCAPETDDLGTDAGSAYVFRTTDGGLAWTQTQELTASDGGESDQFGVRAAISGSLVVVGMNGDDRGTLLGAGSAYIFRTVDDGLAWEQTQKLTASDAAIGDDFGWSVDISGSVVVVGLHAGSLDDESTAIAGSAYVFQTLDDGLSWTQTNKLEASDATTADLFGYAVAVDGGDVLVGARDATAAYAFEIDAVVEPPSGLPTMLPGISQPSSFSPSSIALFAASTSPTFEPPPRPSTSRPSPRPSERPTYWGPQVFGANPQSEYFQRACASWCGIFVTLSIVVLLYVYFTSRQKSKNLARVLFTIALSQFDYGGDTLFIGFNRFVTPVLFVAALATYLLPLAGFLLIYRRTVVGHLSRVYRSNAKVLVRYERWDEMFKPVVQLASVCAFCLLLLLSVFGYLLVLFVFISCKLMCVSYFADTFFQAGGQPCSREEYELMFKSNILMELIFESSGELIIAVVDATFRSRQDFRQDQGISAWAVLSIVTSGLILLAESWPYIYNIVWRCQGLSGGIRAVKCELEYTPDDKIGVSFLDFLLAAVGLSRASSPEVVYVDYSDTQQVVQADQVEIPTVHGRVVTPQDLAYNNRPERL
ncbi:hypothetical protein CTAYLR_005692 [Chrysophaeum taylorii]|uniref:Uncharacterized protein n=1 Tax=Chrysophaeum taylorii TaxID=2483200 RepID=A0AAD7XKA6_9STRA|nr:hypothetical protein CTAYLR_005692 [Chrysophaeum taylorii]